LADLNLVNATIQAVTRGEVSEEALDEIVRGRMSSTDAQGFIAGQALRGEFQGGATPGVPQPFDPQSQAPNAPPSADDWLRRLQGRP
jgi:hypothetical protein